MDGKFDDWQSLQPAHEDATGDQKTGDLDFGRLWITNDTGYLYLRLEVGKEINLQDKNEITLLIDSDNDSMTGIASGDMGVDLMWTFGDREGTFVRGNETVDIRHADIGLVTLPTATSTEFEIALSRVALPEGTTPLFSGDSISIAFRDMGEGADRLPDMNGVKYAFSEDTPAPLQPISIEKRDENSLRIMTYNVLTDGLFKTGQSESIQRILKAIQPDIIGFQEIYDHGAEETAAQIQKALPLRNGEKWYSAKAGGDNIVVSKFPIEYSFVIEDNGAFIINTRPVFDSNILLVVAHLPCCGNNEGRQLEIDAIMSFIRDARQPLGDITLAESTPILLIGDLNLVGYARQLRTLLEGDIADTPRYGLPFAPDWDRTPFADLLPHGVNIPFSFTWYDPNSSFSPGRLDYMIYSDSVIEAVKKFILFTPALPPDMLAEYGLKTEDTLNASDHLPVVADFVMIE